MKISIVTTTFNRSHLLPRLYESLIKQSNRSFNWLVVDDGSEDDTELLINKYISEHELSIVYMKKENGGKHTAINLAVMNCESEYIFFVDSDDVLPINSIEKIMNAITKIENHNDFNNIAGVCGIKSDLNFKIVGNKLSEEIICNYMDYRYKYEVVGDKAEVFKTSILKCNVFPVFRSEKFCPEGLVWNRIAKNNKMYFFNEIIYNCEYQNDGLTSKSKELRKNSPNATLLYYSELAQSDIKFKYRLRAILNYWRFYYLIDKTKLEKELDVPKGLLSIISNFLMFTFQKIL